jgi:hypothetical protein
MIFNIDDKVVCINNKDLEWVLKLNTIYTVSKVDVIFVEIKLKGFNNSYFSENRFMLLSENRSLKINKIKKRICSK